MEHKEEVDTDLDPKRSLFMQGCPALAVSFVRLLLALALAPISMLLSSCLMTITITKRYMEVSGQQPSFLLPARKASSRGRSQSKITGNKTRRRSVSRSKSRSRKESARRNTIITTTMTTIMIALLPVVSAFGFLVGLGLGFVFILCWAFYGEGAPEEPFSLLTVSQTERRSIPTKAEAFANDVRRSYARQLAFDTVTITKGRCRIHCHVVKPKRKKAKGLILLQHGLHSHGGASRMVKVAAHFATEHNFVVYSPDALGHGRSSGGFGVVFSFQELAENFAYVADACHEKHPDLDLFIKGASLGGLIGLWSPNFMQRGTLRKLRGIISVCPALMVHEAAGSKVLVEIVKCLPADILKYMFPKLPTTNGPKGVSFSEDPELHHLAQEESDADPLEYKSRVKFATALTFIEFLISKERREKLIKELQRSVAKFPVLIQHGTLDKCVDVNASRQFMVGLKSPSKRLIEYEGKCHVLLSEDEETASKYLHDMSDFVAQHSSTL